MRTLRNIDKADNETLSTQFSFLLKMNEDLSSSDVSWVAATVFDHWLYESKSSELVESATEQEKSRWGKKIGDLLEGLVGLDEPLSFRFKGRHPKKRLQFRKYIAETPVADHLKRLYETTYDPRFVFPGLGVEIFFEDGWIVYFRYTDIEKFAPVIELIAKLQLFLLPVYTAEHLNSYEDIEKKAKEQGLNKALHRTSR